MSATVQGDKSVQNAPQSIGVLNRDDIRRNEGVFLDDVINLIPGVRFESRTTAGGQRITIRGYGNNTNFNGSGYKAYIDGVPLTDAEGTTVLDDVDFSTLRRVEVIKGPSSSLYGQGIGGVVNFYTLRPEPNTTSLSQEVTGGSQNLFRSNTRYEYGSDNSSFLFNYGHQHSDGYRVHSLSNKDFFLLSAEYRPSSKQSISTYASYNHSFDQLAGQLTEDQFLADQNVAEAPYLSNNGHVAIDSARLGLTHKYEFISGFGNTTTVFASGNQLDQPFAVGLSDNMTLSGGGRTQFDLLAGPVRAAFGTEIEDTVSFKKSYGLVNSVVGAIRGDLQVRSLQSNTFAQASMGLPADFTLVAGASLNVVRYSISDRLANSANPTHLNGSGIKSFDPAITPRVAVEKLFTPDLMAYAQVSRGYTPPPSANVVVPQIGAVNKDLGPEYGMLYEIGSKGTVDRLHYEAALFWLRINDKLTPETVVDPNSGTVLYTQTVNAGSQNDRGVELAASYDVIRAPNGPVRLLRAFGAYTFSDFVYDGFTSDARNGATAVNFSGNQVVGVPKHTAAAGLDIGTQWGPYANATWQYVASVPLTFDNQHSARSYSLLDAKAGYKTDLPAGFTLDAYLGGRNLTGSTYYTMVFLNQSYAGPPPTVFLPGPSSPSLFGGIFVSKTWR